MTVKDWLQKLSEQDNSTEEDSIKMQNLLHMIDEKRARVTCGIVYLNPPHDPPISIHSMAKELSQAIQSQE